MSPSYKIFIGFLQRFGSVSDGLQRRQRLLQCFPGGGKLLLSRRAKLPPRFPRRATQLHNPRLPKRRDPGVAVTQFTQHGRGILAECRGRFAVFDRRRRQMYRIGHLRRAAAVGMRHVETHAACLHLRIGAVPETR